MKFALLIIYLIMGVTVWGCNTFDSISDPSIIESLRPTIVDDTNVRRFHVATRPHNRKVVYHANSGYWFIFYGHGDRDPDGKHRISWRSSKDGVHWSERHTAFEGGSHSSSLDVLLTGDKMTTLMFRPHYHREKSGIPEFSDGKRWYQRPEEDFPLPYEIRRYEIKDGDLISGPIYMVMSGTAFNGRAHYGSLTRDTDGFFWVGARAIKGSAQKPFQAWVVRSSKPDDISQWEPHTVLFKTSGHGTVAVQVIALDCGRVFAVIFSKPDIKIYGSLYDPKRGKWEMPYVIAEGNSTSKRAAASFDRGAKRLHLVNIDDSGALRHKILLSPYRKQDWLPQAGEKAPGIMIDSKAVTKSGTDNNFSLSIDTSRTPAPLVVAYNKRTPHYYLRWFDGREWGKKSFQIGMQNPDRYVDEISLIRDYSSKLGLIYYVLPDKMHRGELHFLTIPKEIHWND